MDRVTLGLGEKAQIRQATPAERSLHRLREGDLVLEYQHTDREPDVTPACGVIIEARRYGVRLPDRFGDNE